MLSAHPSQETEGIVLLVAGDLLMKFYPAVIRRFASLTSMPRYLAFTALPIRMAALTSTDAPLIDSENLFRQPGPPQDGG